MNANDRKLKEFTDRMTSHYQTSIKLHTVVGLAWLTLSGFALKDSFNEDRAPSRAKTEQIMSLAFAGAAAFSGVRVAKNAIFLKRMKEFDKGQ